MDWGARSTEVLKEMHICKISAMWESKISDTQEWTANAHPVYDNDTYYLKIYICVNINKKLWLGDIINLHN